MTTLRRASAALVLALVALLASCTELDGQRISIRYDAAADVLHVLLHYDGIHEKNGDSPAAREQVPAFLAGGDVLLLDWFGHVEMKEIREEAEKEGTPPAMKAFLHALAGSVKARAVGHYRDPRGRIGAVQHVEVRDASVLVRKANAALNEGILSGHADPEWRRTAARMEAGAREGRQWIFLDGHAVGITFAADPAEWALIRRKAVRDIAREFAEERRKEEGDPGPDGLEEAPPGETPEAAALRIAEAARREAAARVATPRARGFGLAFLGLSPVALVETAESVTFRIGDPGRPSTLRIPLRDVEDHSLDEVVLKAVPRDLDGALADRVLGGTAAGDADLLDLLRWGPPEEKGRVLLLRARNATGEGRDAALAGLASFAEAWNRDVGIPRAPVAGAQERDGAVPDPKEDPEGHLRSWAAWYADVVDGLPR